MASSTTSTCPASTRSPTATATRTTLPGMGASADPAATCSTATGSRSSVDQPAGAVGTVDVVDRPDPLDGVVPGDPGHRQGHRVRVRRPRPTRRATSTVEFHLGHRPPPATHAVGHDQAARAAGERDLLTVDEIVAPAGRKGGEGPGRSPPLGLAGQGRRHRVAPHGSGVGQGCGQRVQPVAVEEPGVGGSGGERRVAQASAPAGRGWW